MTVLASWLAAALAAAQAAQRDDGCRTEPAVPWLTVTELERAGHDPHDADHIARWGPEVVIAVLAVVSASIQAWPTIEDTVEYARLTEALHALDAALSALAAATT